MRLVYLDDSESDSGFQLMGAVIVPENQFLQIEGFLAHLIDKYVPEESRDSFEFHASALFQGKGAFAAVPHEKAVTLFENCVSIVTGVPVPIIYGGIDTRKLRSSIYATAMPIDIAFRVCVAGIAGWFLENPTEEIGVLICDDTSNAHQKSNLQKAFRAYRRRLKSKEHDRGLLQWVHDDMYFGDSAFSVGIQLADICTYIILRHRQGKQDTEYLYQILEPQIFYGLMEPDGEPHGNANAISDTSIPANWIAAIRD